MMRPSASLALCLAAALGGSAAGPQPQDRPFHVTHYDLLIRPDFAARRLRVVAAVTVENPSLADSFEFALSDRYTDVRVVRADSSPAEAEHVPGGVLVHVGAPRAREVLVFTLEGEPERSLDEDRDVIASQSLFLLWSDRFYPLRFEDWATARTTVVLPAGFTAIAPGRLIGRRSDGTAVRWTFETTHPSRLFSVLADTRWIRTERVIDGLRMQTLLYPESQRFSEQILATSADVLGFYRQLYGPYLFDGFTFLTVDSLYARRAFDGFVGYSPRYLEREFTTTGLDAHETALLWWFYTAAGRGPGSFQWTEGFGDYAEILYDQARHKPVPAIFDRFRAGYLALPADSDVPYTALRGSTSQDIVHGRYPWLMQVLRYVVGDQAFRRAMRLLFDRYRFGTFSMDELVATLEEGTGRSLRWWREEWLERRGVPELSVRWSAVCQSSGCRVTGAVTQAGNVYHIPLEIAVETERGAVRERIRLAAPENAFFVDVPARPVRVTLDSDHWLLARFAAP
jgi:aminopeptidase N